MICPGSPRHRARDRGRGHAISAVPPGIRRPGAAFGAMCVTTTPHCLGPGAPHGGTVTLWAACSPLTAPPTCVPGGGREAQTPVLPGTGTEEPAGAGAAPSGRIQGWEARSGVVPGPTEPGPETAVSTEGLDISEERSQHGGRGRGSGLRASLSGTAPRKRLLVQAWAPSCCGRIQPPNGTHVSGTGPTQAPVLSSPPNPFRTAA